MFLTKVRVSCTLLDGTLLDSIELEVSADDFSTVLAVHEITPKVGPIHMLELGKLTPDDQPDI